MLKEIKNFGYTELIKIDSIKLREDLNIINISVDKCFCCCCCDSFKDL